MATKIDPNITPRPEDYAALQKDGIPREFVDWEMKRFIEYWQETGGKKKAWFTTIRTWMRRAFQGSAGAEFERIKDQLCSNRNGRLKTDLFDSLLTNTRERVDCAQTCDGPITVGKTSGMDSSNPVASQSGAGCYRIIEHNKPEQGPPMKTEDALDELARMFK